MKQQTREALDAYYAEGDSWAHDRNDALRTSRRLAWIVAAVAVAVALCEALALVFLAPLKTVVPYTLLVDRQTGFVQELKPLDAQLVSADAALTQSFLVQYVIAREGFDANSLQGDYRKVALWSAGEARSSYLATMQPSSSDSPLARYPRSSVVEVRVKSVTAITKTSAMVRFDTVRHDAGGQAAPARPWVAVVRFGYSGAPMSVEDRFVNPLGFQVSRYRRSAEALPPPEAQPEPSSAIAPGVGATGLPAAQPQSRFAPPMTPVLPMPSPMTVPRTTQPPQQRRVPAVEL